ncbi:MAG: hypothetical protein ABWZ76_11300, partial [Acidimicrobiales bacterium]
TWFSGYSICILVGECIGPVLAEDDGPIEAFIRGGDPSVLTVGAPTTPSPTAARARPAGRLPRVRGSLIPVLTSHRREPSDV